MIWSLWILLCSSEEYYFLIFCFSRCLIWLNSNIKLLLSSGGQKVKCLSGSIDLRWSAWNLSNACIAQGWARDLNGVYIQNLELLFEAVSFLVFLLLLSRSPNSVFWFSTFLISSHSQGCWLGLATKQKVAKPRKLIQCSLFLDFSFFWLLSSTPRKLF